jgi:uncharacterized membrane protein YbhN (UPF0104 family)
VKAGRIRNVQLLFWIVMGALTIGGLAFVIRLDPAAVGRIGRVIARIPPARWVTITLGVVAFYMTDWLRFYALLRLFDVRISPLFGLRLTCVSYFAASLTPWQELHLPAMILLMMAAGIPPAVATAVTAAKSLYTVFWICATACLALALTPGLALPPAFRPWLPLYLAPVVAMCLGMALVVVFAPRLHAAAVRALGAPQPHWRRKAWAALDHATGALAIIGRSRSPWHALCHGAALGLVASYGFIGHELAHGLGFPLGYGRAVAVFGNGLMAAYLSPVPGSFGVGEGFTAWLLDARLSDEALAAGVLSRVLCWYIVMVPGAIILVLAIRRHGYAVWKRLLWGEREPL